MKKIFVNGSFDLIHRAHVDLLNYAASLGDYLLVGLDTDLRITQLKGPTRPIYNQYARYTIISSLRAVDEVRFFNSEQELIDMIREYNPDVMVKGSDYRNGIVIGREYCKHVEFFERQADYATTKTIQDIINRGQLH